MSLEISCRLRLHGARTSYSETRTALRIHRRWLSRIIRTDPEVSSTVPPLNLLGSGELSCQLLRNLFLLKSPHAPDDGTGPTTATSLSHRQTHDRMDRSGYSCAQIHADGTKIRLAGLKGSPVVLYFYPKDDTPGCTKEACAFRNRRADIEALGARVLGISPDDVDSHLAFSKNSV